MPYRVINIYYSVTCYTNHINSTRIQSIASMALTVFPDVASRIHKGKLQYLVHWKGYEEHEHTWEPALNLKNAPSIVELFYKENPSAPWKLCMAQADFDSLFTPIPENLTVCDTQFCSLESCS